MQSPAQRLEELLTPWSTYIILPLFALANAGVAINPDSVSTLTSPVSLGIILGLIIGKPVGISLLSYGAYKLGLAQLPEGIQWRQIISASFLAGIGFTMALFISSAAFADETELLKSSKLAILVASVLAAVVGSVSLLVTSSPATEHSEMAPAAATGD